MGVQIRSFTHYNSRQSASRGDSRPKGCVAIAQRLLDKVFECERAEGRPLEFTHLWVATSCPDQIAPSIGQSLQSHYHDILPQVPTLDIVQGCAGSVTSLNAAAELTQARKGRALFVAVDAASEAVSPRSPLHADFSDGGFACVLEGNDSPDGPRHLKGRTCHYPESVDVVRVELGHKARERIRAIESPKDKIGLEDQLGLHFGRRLAVQLASQAGQFAKEFFDGLPAADFVILHQVNPTIIEGVRRRVFPDHPGFLDLTREIGNCGVSTVGVVLGSHWQQVQGKKVFLCSFGTGGVISGSYWQL